MLSPNKVEKMTSIENGKRRSSHLGIKTGEALSFLSFYLCHTINIKVYNMVYLL